MLVFPAQLSFEYIRRAPSVAGAGAGAGAGKIRFSMNAREAEDDLRPVYQRSSGAQTEGHTMRMKKRCKGE